ncbi:MAG: aminotransferase class I/II-fold pyridoxal phosphate-dependent enzyme, partial [Patescibacteria group bacterium]|nr:aminotransferase class I/II-fold pyridoxal phosphate-dependent enzyme [Patescibacteria group bacterium]
GFVVTVDDAYFGLFYDDRCMKQSIFSELAELDERVIAVKLDGATKEEFVWGFRCGFISFASAKTPPEVFEALGKKVMGLTRGSISNCPHPSQTIVLKALKSGELQVQKKQKLEVMRERAAKVHEVLSNPKYNDAWDVYPFNSGYFMCLKLKTVEAEPLRKHLLDKYGVGIIASAKSDIRIAFSCLETKDIQEVFEIIYNGVKDLQG